MTRQEFIDQYGTEGYTDQERQDFLDTQIVLPCNCEYEKCNGWQMADKKHYSWQLERGLIDVDGNIT